MARIEVKGYCNKPVRRDSARGGFQTFTLAERQKERDGSYTKVYYDCAYFGGADLSDGDFVEVKGYFNTGKYKSKTGEERQSLRVSIHEDGLTIAPKLGPREGKDSNDIGAAPSDDAIPF